MKSFHPIVARGVSPKRARRIIHVVRGFLADRVFGTCPLTASDRHQFVGSQCTGTVPENRIATAVFLQIEHLILHDGKRGPEFGPQRAIMCLVATQKSMLLLAKCTGRIIHVVRSLASTGCRQLKGPRAGQLLHFFGAQRARLATKYGTVRLLRREFEHAQRPLQNVIRGYENSKAAARERNAN